MSNRFLLFSWTFIIKYVKIKTYYIVFGWDRMERIKWLFFDLGATLIDESKCYEYRCNEIINNNNIDAKKFYEKVLEFAKITSLPIKAAAEYYGYELPGWSIELEQLYAETKRVLAQLSYKYKLGIISNQVAGTQERINSWDIGKYFDVVVASAETGCEKPDLKIFNIALTKAECQGSQAVMIGDRLDNDIAPAKKLGMKTVWVRQGFAKFQSVNRENEKPDYIIESIGEITNFF